MEMNTYKSLVRLVVTQKVTTTTNVVVQAQDAYKAKLQLEAMYGKGNVVSYPQLVRWYESRVKTIDTQASWIRTVWIKIFSSVALRDAHRRVNDGLFIT